MSVFPTFRLPFLAAKAVVNRMDIDDLTALFLCSKKTRAFIKSLQKSVSFDALSIEQKKSLNFLEIMELFREEKLTGKFLKEYSIEADIKISENIGFQLKVQFNNSIQEQEREVLWFQVYAESIDQQEQHKGTKRNLRIGGINIPVIMTEKDGMYMFWENKHEVFKKMGIYLKENFDSCSAGLYIEGGKSRELSENLRFVINWINLTKRRLMHCTVKDHNRSISDEDIKYVIDNVYAWLLTDFSVELSDQFQHTTHFKSSWLKLKPANWFTLKNLEMTECLEIHLSESQLTNNDLNSYLKQWMGGKFPDLRKLCVEMQENININMIISGLSNSTQRIYTRHHIVFVEGNGRFAAEILPAGKTPKTFEMKISPKRY